MTENRAWKKLPDEEGKWWYWKGVGESRLIIYDVMRCLPEENRYFPAGTGAWCDEMGGFWSKAEIPAPPTAVERADAEAAWLKRFEGTMKADTERIVEDTKIEGEKHEPTVDNRRICLPTYFHHLDERIKSYSCANPRRTPQDEQERIVK